MLSISLAAVALTLALTSSAQHHHVAAAPAAADADVRVSRVRLKTGVELQVAQRGPVDGAPVLFLHGYTDSWFSFSTTLDHLPSTVRAIVPTQRGHGDSERPECCYRVNEFAADAVALLDALGVARATVVGHSMGSFVAQRIASEWPGRVHRLVLSGSGTTPQTPSVLELNRSVQKLIDPVGRAFVREFQEGSVAKPVSAAFLDRAIHESEKVSARLAGGPGGAAGPRCRHPARSDRRRHTDRVGRQGRPVHALRAGRADARDPPGAAAHLSRRRTLAAMGRARAVRAGPHDVSRAGRRRPHGARAAGARRTRAWQAA